MSNPRIEEVSDDDDVDIAEDPDEMDLDSFDFARPQKGSLQPAMDPAASQIDPQELQAMMQAQNQQQPSAQNGPQQTPWHQMSDKERERISREERERTKDFQCIYPVYFDATRSREEGRRVKKEDAVQNPLARDIVEAIQHVAQSIQVPLSIAFEPSKTHPKDWANPGRVKVQVKRDGKPVTAKLANKHQLYKLIADYLKRHPTTAHSPFKLRLEGVPMPAKDKHKPPAIPRGFKMGSVLPLHSPAISGGGVSENFLQEMMQEMGGQLPPGMQGMAGLGGGGGGSGGAGGAPKKVKDKKKK